ncbi:MAG: AlpA family phage regulatory protein [Deltaproteobacteria bacterium]|nr:AlpA family phage regulatory protein [Deltaproteobacteria bacterium]
MRTRAVLELTGLSRTSLWRRVRTGEFPNSVRLGGPNSRAVGWLRPDIERWLETLSKT